MDKRRKKPLPADQMALFSDPDHCSPMSWVSIPERSRERVIECLAQLLRESSDRSENSEGDHE